MKQINKKVVLSIFILIICLVGGDIAAKHHGLSHRMIHYAHGMREYAMDWSKVYKGRSYVPTGDSTINCIGDSITQGDRNDDISWVDRLETLTEANHVHKYGIGGSTVSTYVDQHPMCIRYREMSDEADYIVIFAGNNDFTQSVPMGTPDSFDTDTFYGALNVMLSGIREKYPTGKILYVTPLRMWNYRHPEWEEPVQYDSHNQQGLTLKDYRDAIINRCDYYSIPYLDLYEQGLYGRTEKTREAVYVDGLHPNDKGHRMIASMIAESLKRL